MKNFIKTHKDKLLIGIIFISYVFLLLNINIISNGFSKFFNLLTPFIYGFILAYLLNPLLNFLENAKVIKKIKKEETRHILSIILSYIVLVGMLVTFFIFVVPDIWNSLKQIIKEIPSLSKDFESWLISIKDKLPFTLPFLENDFKWSEMVSENLNKVVDFLSKNWGDYTTKAVDITKNVTGTVVDIVLGIIISLYMLLQKKTFIRQANKTLYAIVPENRYRKIMEILKQLHIKVSQFITVKLLDSFILGVLCFIGLFFIGVGHKIPIATLIGVGNVIPYFGSFLATIPCAIIVLAESPIKAVIFIIFVLILQWVDNNIISPKLMGDSLDLHAFWVLFAVIIMTGLFGITGLLLGVPIFAVLYALVKEFIEEKLKNKPPLYTDENNSQ